MRALFNILAVVGMSTFAGVMLVIGVTLGGYWRSLNAAEFLRWFSENNHFIWKLIPMVVIPTLIGLVGSLWQSWSTASERTLWAAATVCVAAILALTAGWFLPANAQFSARVTPLDAVSTRLGTWLMLHYVRIALAFLGSISGAVAMLCRAG